MAIQEYADKWGGPEGPADVPGPARESACKDANRLVGKLESACNALDAVQARHGPESLVKAQTGEPGLLDALDRAHQLASQLDRRVHELAELIGRL